MSKVVVDASAVLAVLNREPGWEAIAAQFEGACWSTVNVSEVVAKLAEAGMPPAEIRIVLRDLLLRVVPFDEDHALEAGRLRPLTRPLGLSLADRACLALGGRLGRPVLTTDRAWRDLGIGVEIRVGR